MDWNFPQDLLDLKNRIDHWRLTRRFVREALPAELHTVIPQQVSLRKPCHFSFLAEDRHKLHRASPASPTFSSRADQSHTSSAQLSHRMPDRMYRTSPQAVMERHTDADNGIHQQDRLDN